MKFIAKIMQKLGNDAPLDCVDRAVDNLGTTGVITQYLTPWSITVPQHCLWLPLYHLIKPFRRRTSISLDASRSCRNFYQQRWLPLPHAPSHLLL